MRPFALILGLALISGCGGGSDGGTGPLPIASVEVVGATMAFEVGQAVQFTAVTRDKNGSPVSAGSVQWSVSPATVAKVTPGGLVTALAAGTATVTATAGGVSGNAAVSITDNGIPFTTTVFMPGNAFSPFNVTIRVGGTVNFEFPAEEHDVTFVRVAGAPANIPVTTGKTIGRTFTVAGTFAYDCLVHPGMSGQVTVVQ